MKLKNSLIAALFALCTAAPAAAQDSMERGSAASVSASLVAGYSAAWIAHQGAELTVRAIKTSANGIELSLQGAGAAIETSALVAKDVVEAASVGVGTTLQVVAESTGYALLASGTLLAFVPNEVGRALLHHSRH